MLSGNMKPPNTADNVINNTRVLDRIVGDTARFYRTFRDLSPEISDSERSTFLKIISTWQGQELEAQIMLRVNALDAAH